MAKIARFTNRGDVASSTLPRQTLSLILAWLNASHKDEDAPPILDFGQFEKNAARLRACCGAHPKTGLITAADSPFDKKFGDDR